jgi:hypothetical protein
VIAFRASTKADEQAVSILTQDKQHTALHVGGTGAIPMLLVFNDGYVAERDGLVKGCLLFVPWYSTDGVKNTTEARLTFFAVRKDEELLRDMLLDIYHRALIQNNYEISYVDIAVDNCFAMEIFLARGYRVTEDVKNAAGKREGYRLYKSL